MRTRSGADLLRAPGPAPTHKTRRQPEITVAGTDLGAAEPAVVGLPGAASGAAPEAADAVLSDAIDRQRRNVQVQGSGRVLRVLADDNDGSRHQRFILALACGRTLLIVHNIDLAPRLLALLPGDLVAFHGEYEWSERGGVVHWTHHDPQGLHAAGWLRHNDRVYQ